MSSIDDRIVQMQFDNDQFEKGVSQTNDSLQQLQENLKLDGATQGLDNVQKSMDSLNLGNIADGVDRISSAFSTLGIIGINVLSRVTQGVIGMGESLLNATLQPLIEGGRNRAIAIEQAKFQFRGLGLDITKTMAAAKAAVLGTQFGLQDAATAAAQLGASNITVGHGLEGTLRAISGVAAQTGRSYSDIANIFEKVAGNGRLMGQDLLSLSASGLNAAAILAKSLHTTEANVRQMVTDGKISFAEFSTAMNNAFGKNAAKANETFTGALANMKAALSRIGADIFTPLDEAERKVFNALGPVFDALHAALIPVITQFGVIANLKSDNFVKFLSTLNFSGLETIANSVGYAMRNVYTAITLVGKAIGKGFKQIFPKTTTDQVQAFAKVINDLSVAFLHFTQKNSGQITRTFAGFFAVLDIGWQIISRVIKVLLDLFGFASSGNGTFLDLTAVIGDFLVKVDKAVKSGKFLNNFFAVLGNVLKVPITILHFFVSVIETVIEAIETLAHGHSLDEFAEDTKKRFSGLIELVNFFKSVFEGLKKVIDAIMTFISPFIQIMVDAVHKIGDTIGEAFKHLTFEHAIQAINTGLFAALVFGLRGLFGNLGNVLKGNLVGITTPIKTILTAFRVNLKALEMNTNAKTLKEIAISVALLAASAVALSLVDPVRLAGALAAMGAMVQGLIYAFKSFAAITKPQGISKLLLISATLNLIAIAVLTLSIAVAVLGAIPVDNLIRGLGSVLLIMTAFTQIGEHLKADDAKNLIIVAASMYILGQALLVLSGAIAILGALSWEQLAKGLGAVTILLGELIATVKIIGESGPKTTAAAVTMLLLAVSLNAIAASIAILGHLSFEQMIQGLAGLGAVLLLISLTLESLENTTPGAVAMIIAAGAIIVLATAMKILSTIKPEQLVIALVALAGGMLILVAAVAILGTPETLLGAAALIIVAGALFIIAPALKLLGTMSWDAIGRGLTILAASLGILIVAGIALIPALPGLLGLGLAVALIGAGAFAAGVGIGLFAAGMALLGTVGYAALKLIGPAIQEFLKQLPAIAIAFGEAIGTFALVIATKGPEILAAITTVLLALIQSIITLVPQIVDAAVVLITSLVNALVVLIPLLVDAGLKIVVGILTGIANNIGGIVKAGSDIMINFMNAMAAKLPDIIKAGGNLVLSFINGIGDYIANNSDRFVKAGSKLFRAIIDGVSAAIKQGGKDIRYAGEQIGNALFEGAMNAIWAHSPSRRFRDEFMGAVFDGIDTGNDSKRANDAGSSVGDAFLNGATKSLANVADALSSNIELAPTITPVLDLSSIAKDSQLIPGMLTPPPLNVDTSANAASSIVTQQKAQEDAKNAAPTHPEDDKPADITFIQNNNSPKALTPAEIYRQTKNQLSVAKKVLVTAP